MVTVQKLLHKNLQETVIKNRYIKTLAATKVKN